MKIKLSFAEVHTPLFLGGANLGSKLGLGSKFSDVELIEDTDEERLIVRHKGKTGRIPLSNVVLMMPFEQEDAKPEPPGISQPADKPGKFKKNFSAQVSTPTSHVFQGPDAA